MQCPRHGFEAYLGAFISAAGTREGRKSAPLRSAGGSSIQVGSFRFRWAALARTHKLARRERGCDDQRSAFHQDIGDDE